MSVKHTLSFSSRLGRHAHILWTDDEFTREQVTVPEYKQSLILNISIPSFKQKMAPLRYGRFYPAQILKHSIRKPAALFRVTALDEKGFTADFNHPLAGKEVSAEAFSPVVGHPAVGDSSMLVEWAGIDAPLNDRDTDYSMPQAFDRMNPSDDAQFYEQPRKVIHTDYTCISRLRALYSDLLNPEDSVLDLMSSWRSHLPEKIRKTSGLGMNAEEMKDNPQLETYLVHDLNKTPQLPFTDRSFHAVINAFSIEYLIEPELVFADIRRVLKPGGLVIVAFSNRYFPPKTIRLWSELHPAERLGWVLQLLRNSGFSDLHCQVERGLLRSQDDHYANKVLDMDPLFAAWGKADMI